MGSALSIDVPAPVNILLVDDEPANLLSLEAVLGTLGQNLVFAHSAEEALFSLLQRDFAVVLLDVQMAGTNGLETARLIRGRDRSRHTPIIFLTAFDTGRSQVEEAYALGAVDFLVKPFAPSILRAKVLVFVELFQKAEQVKRQAERLRQMERRELQGHLAIQYACARAMTEATTVDDAMLRVLRSMAEGLAWDCGSTWLLDPDGDILRCNGVWHGKDVKVAAFQDASQRQVFRRGEGLPGRVWAKAQPIWIRELHADPNFPRWPAAKKDGIRAALGFPIMLGAEFLGVVELLSRENRLRDDTITPMLNAVGSQLGQFIDRKRSEELKLRRSRQLEALSQASRRVNSVLSVPQILRNVVESAIGLVDADGGMAGVVEDGRLRVRERNRAGTFQDVDFVLDPADLNGISCCIAKLSQHYVANDAASDSIVRGDPRAQLGLKSLLVMPVLNREGKLIACFDVHDKRGGPFDETDVTALQGLAAAASVALENARLYENLRENQEQLRVANERKDEFIALLAHELRNPLAPLRTSVHILKMRSDNGTSITQVRDMMDRQINHLSRLVDDLLDVSRIARGKIRLKTERLELGRLLRDVTADQSSALDNAALQLQLDLPDQPLWINGDATRLTQIFDNLLTNAIKFTPRGGNVSVRLRAAHNREHAIVEVHDDGIGMEDSMIGRLFEPFAQADRSLDRSAGGLGLGLALVKGLVELHGGRIEAQSDGPGKGAKFLVEFPVINYVDNGVPLHASLTQRQRDALRVLVVEDNADAAESLQILLGCHGFQVTIARTGKEGLAFAKEQQPDVVLCDIGLPQMDGYAVAQALRADVATRDLHLIALTGYGREEERQKALAAGFDDHLVKPADPAALVEVLQRGRVARVA